MLSQKTELMKSRKLPSIFPNNEFGKSISFGPLQAKKSQEPKNERRISYSQPQLSKFPMTSPAPVKIRVSKIASDITVNSIGVRGGEQEILRTESSLERDEKDQYLAQSTGVILVRDIM